ncbi:sarcosine oxidase subunit delta [Rhizobium herbae]|jgi:methylglutamate dehydrogenase subunit B
MASLIACPHCGPRPKEEFTVRGDAGITRPAPDAGEDAWYAYVYLRDNPRGRHKEHWHHTSGCRRWLVVERDTMTHAIYAVTDASAEGETA